MIWKQNVDADPEVTRSIKQLKTLTVRDGRVSISPEEVLNQPGYLEARAHAASLITLKPCASAGAIFDWSSIDQIGLEVISKAVAMSLLRSRGDGMRFERALDELRHLFTAQEIGE